ncbi:protein unc-93 homolog A-like [Asterias rubens]|uniref:protein unc-93 homolog A-like n=1 Tax=Asterias rubens TaxID=7604 RepID=UPI001455D402|nr:protein unc-93 homolog A-like [Asterias rubens]
MGDIDSTSCRPNYSELKMDNETIARDANGTETRDSDGIEKMEIHEAPDGGSGGISENSAHWGTKRIFKNLLVICLCFMCLFTAFQALSNLQSSINCDAGLGLASLSTIYATLVVSAIFIPSITIRYLGMKWTIAAATLCYAVYIAANFYPSWATLIPTSALLGLSAAPLWAAKSTYVTTIGKRYALISGNTENAIINRFFGIFFLFFQSSQVLGNLISSLVLRQDTSEDVTGEFVCGANDCPAAPDENVTSYCNPPDKSVTNTLIGIYLGSGLAAGLIVSIFLDRLQTSRRTQTENPGQLFLATLRLLKDYRMILLVPLTIYSGLEQGFITGDFTRSYVTCTVGVSWVGYVMICYGVTDALCSFFAGRLVKHIGRVPLFTFGAVMQMTLIFTLIFWVPNKDQLAVLFVIAACWGMADAVWQTQINALYGILFTDKQEAAFSNYRLWESVGFTVSFAYSNYLCVWIKLAILATVLVFGIGFYYIIEMKAYLARKRAEKTKTASVKKAQTDLS